MSLLYLLLFFSFVSAAEDFLAPIEVRSAKGLEKFTLHSSQTLTSDDFSLKPTSLISDNFKDISGLSSAQAGGLGGNTSFFIRGTEARHVSYTIDGLRINDPSSGDRQFDSAFFTDAFLKDITVYKGPQTILFGSDALGGLVEMETRKGERAPETRLSVNAGSFGTLDTSLSKDWSGGPHRGTLTWTSLRTDGISRLNEKRHDSSERDGTDITQLTSSTAHAWTPMFGTDFLFSFLRGNSELDGAVTDNSSDEARNDHFMAQQKSYLELSSNFLLSFRSGISRHQRNIKSSDFGRTSFSGDLLQNELTLNHETKNWKFLAGGVSEQEKFSARKVDLNGAFLQASWKRLPFKVQAGVRSDRHGLFGNNHSGSIGGSFRIKKDLFSIQRSQGFKAPSLYQLYAPVFGNRNLKVETNNALEMRWQHFNSDFDVETVVFQNRLNNLVIFTQDQRFKNQDSFTAEGVELNIDIKTEKFRLRPSLTSQSFKSEESEVLRRPTFQASLRGAWFPKENLELFTHFRRSNSRKDFGGVKLNGYETLDLGVLVTVGKNDYGFQIVNLLDRNYEEIYGYSVMPRSVFFHYGIKL